MVTFLLHFTIDLRGYDIPSAPKNNGPLFHRWLPDGENDAIALDIPKSKAQLKLWFERRGLVEDQFIKYDSKRHEVDPNIMIKQGVLEGGPLTGLLAGCELSEEELVALKEDRKGDPAYEALGKRVINLIYPPVSRLIHIIRRNYGQYWVEELEEWDSREQPLGRYCQSILHAEWSLDNGKTWQPFVPNDPVGSVHITIELSKKRFMDYISKEDWQCLTSYYEKGYSPPPSANILLRTHELLDQGNLRQAFIEGITALEVALSEFMRDRLNGRDALQKSLGNFFDLRLQSQLTSVAVALALDLGDIESAIEAITIRNKIVHEGYDPPSSFKDKLQGLMNVTARLISGPNIKFPTINPGNAIRPVEDWESTD